MLSALKTFALRFCLSSNYIWIALILLMVTLVTGCEGNNETVPATAVSPDPQSNLDSAKPTATIENTPTPRPMAEFMGVRFVYNDEMVGQLLHARHEAAVPAVDATSFGQPESITFWFDSQNPHNLFNPYIGQVLVFPAEHYARQSPQAADRISSLSSMLDERPLEVMGDMPLLPIIPGQETFHSRPSYFEFENGQGVSFLTQYDIEPTLITNEDMFYTFQGLSDDEQFYVAAFFPVNSAILPANQTSNNTAVPRDDKSWAEYQGKTVMALNELSTSDFTPDLVSLNRMMGSLLVQPDEGFPSPLMADYAHYSGVMVGYDPHLIKRYNGEKIPAQYTHADGTVTLLEGVPDIIRLNFYLNGGNGERPSTMWVQPVRDNAGNFYESIPNDLRAYLDALEEQLAGNGEHNNPNQAHFRRLPFQSGVGVRALKHNPAVSAPETAVITNDSLAYIFEGLTHDGMYYVKYKQPLHTDARPDRDNLTPEEIETANNEPEVYTGVVMATLNEVDAAAFNPDLTQLDQMMHSLAISPAASKQSSIPENPADCINAAEFLEDATIEDGAVIERGETFTKIWRIRNTGTCTWTPAYRLVFHEGDDLELLSTSPIEVVEPGHETEASITLKSPEEPGEYKSFWWLVDEQGQGFETRLFVKFAAPEPAETLDGYGVIEGGIAYPAGGLPAMTIYFQRTDSIERYALETEEGWNRYVNNIPVGEYTVFARVTGDSSDFGGGYTEAVICGLSADCTDHTLLPVDVKEGKTARNIDIADWYAPSGTFPLP